MNLSLIHRDIGEESQLAEFAQEFAPCLRPPLVIYLVGPLGAGKTTFVRALAGALGYSGRVKSPTYGLMERYEIGEMSLLHLDLYRLENEAELDFLALRDEFTGNSVLLIEWPGRGGSTVPAADVMVQFSEAVEDRSLTVSARSLAGEGVVSGISR